MNKKILSAEKMLKRLHDEYYSDVIDNINILCNIVDIDKEIDCWTKVLNQNNSNLDFTLKIFHIKSTGVLKMIIIYPSISGIINEKNMQMSYSPDGELLVYSHTFPYDKNYNDMMIKIKSLYQFNECLLKIIEEFFKKVLNKFGILFTIH